MNTNGHVLELYDAMGRLVNSKKLNNLVSGANEIQLVPIKPNIGASAINNPIHESPLSNNPI